MRSRWPQVYPHFRDPFWISCHSATLKRGQHILLPWLTERQAIERQRLL